ncbi:MAG: hypothetical protein ACLGIN_00140 [Candidatus Sericytochromatia bacterium]
MERGTVDWIEDRLADSGGEVGVRALEAAMREEGASDEEVAALHVRLRRSPRLLTLPGRTVALTRRYLVGARFRYMLTGWEVAHGVLSLEGTELPLVLGQGAREAEQAVRWGLEREREIRRVLLARRDGPDRRPAWVLPGLGEYFEAHGLGAGDDLLVRVEEIEEPLLRLGHVAFEARDAAIAVRNAELTAAAASMLAEAGSWVGMGWVLKQLLGRFDYRQAPPPDAFGRRLAMADRRFLLSPDGDEIREAHFHDETTAMRYLSRLSAPEEALSAYYEERPGDGAPRRAEALASLEALWRRTPRPELGGLTPAEIASAGRLPS